jgi:hypothetical protein
MHTYFGVYRRVGTHLSKMAQIGPRKGLAYLGMVAQPVHVTDPPQLWCKVRKHTHNHHAPLLLLVYCSC